MSANLLPSTHHKAEFLVISLRCLPQQLGKPIFRQRPKHCTRKQPATCACKRAILHYSWTVNSLSTNKYLLYLATVLPPSWSSTHPLHIWLQNWYY